jgi:hypothetical protein
MNQVMAILGKNPVSMPPVLDGKVIPNESGYTFAILVTIGRYGVEGTHVSNSDYMPSMG